MRPSEVLFDLSGRIRAKDRYPSTEEEKRGRGVMRITFQSRILVIIIYEFVLHVHTELWMILERF